MNELKKIREEQPVLFWFTTLLTLIAMPPLGLWAVLLSGGLENPFE